MAPGLICKKQEARLQDALSVSESQPLLQGYLFRLCFLIPEFISDCSNRCMGRETRSKRAKAASSFCLTLCSLAVWLQAPGMCTWAAWPSCPETWLHKALWQVFGSGFLVVSSRDQLFAGKSKYNSPCVNMFGTYNRLDKQWITATSSIHRLEINI